MTGLTCSSERIGSLGYMAPEQEEGRYSPQSDLYACGRVLYFMLTGKHPGKQRGPISARRPDLPADLDALYLKAIEGDPADRFASAQEMSAALDDVLRILKREKSEPASRPLPGKSPVSRVARSMARQRSRASSRDFPHPFHCHKAIRPSSASRW